MNSAQCKYAESLSNKNGRQCHLLTAPAERSDDGALERF
jgi:hypothetical protein